VSDDCADEHCALWILTIPDEDVPKVDCPVAHGAKRDNKEEVNRWAG